MQKPANALIEKDNITPEMVNGLLVSLGEKDQALKEKDETIDQLLTMIHLMRQKRFGHSSESFSPDQLQIFDETELDRLLKSDDEPEVDSSPVEVEPVTPNKKPKRRPLPEHYPRIERIIDLPDDEKAAMGDDWVLIGYDQSEQLSVTPRQHYVITTRRARYAPVNESVAGAEAGIRTAPRPDHIIPKSIAHSSVIADAIANKFIDAQPFYRQA